jgi:hypothetical protein
LLLPLRCCFVAVVAVELHQNTCLGFEVLVAHSQHIALKDKTSITKGSERDIKSVENHLHQFAEESRLYFRLHISIKHTLLASSPRDSETF